MSKTIYVVTSGEYSDYGIEAMFSKEKDAATLVRYYNATHRYDDARIEEWALDAGMNYPPKGMNFYRVDMDRNLEGKTWVHKCTWMQCSYVSKFWSGVKKETLHMTVAAWSEEHAIKIVNEKRTQLIATEQWDALK